MGRLAGRIALVTGGIGLATAKAFVDEGAFVFITGRRGAELAAAVREIGHHVTGVQGDVSNPGDLDRLFEQIDERRADSTSCSRMPVWLSSRHSARSPKISTTRSSTSM